MKGRRILDRAKPRHSRLNADRFSQIGQRQGDRTGKRLQVSTAIPELNYHWTGDSAGAGILQDSNLRQIVDFPFRQDRQDRLE